MTTEILPAPSPVEAPAPRPRIFSGIQPSGVPHVGNDLGAIRNYVKLQWEYEAIYCIVDYHALTSLHDADRLRTQTREMAAALLALGLDPERCTLFVQSHRPEVTELAWLLMTVTPVSWLERTPTYKEKKQYQPEDINHGLLPEPQAVHTEAPIVLGTDGVRKMSKSLGNTIDIFAPEDTIRKQIMSMVTDTKRILRTDPGRPEVCNVCQLHRSYGDDYEEIWDGERTARTGCVDTKKLLAERILAHYAEARERYGELMADPARVDRVLEDGAERVRSIAQATMDEVHLKMGLR
jgi:tryptophanyl-tRNA synthetase